MKGLQNQIKVNDGLNRVNNSGNPKLGRKMSIGSQGNLEAEEEKIEAGESASD